MLTTSLAVTKPAAHTILNPMIVPVSGIGLCEPWLANILLCRSFLGKGCYSSEPAIWTLSRSVSWVSYGPLSRRKRETTVVEQVCL